MRDPRIFQEICLCQAHLILLCAQMAKNPFWAVLERAKGFPRCGNSYLKKDFYLIFDNYTKAHLYKLNHFYELGKGQNGCVFFLVKEASVLFKRRRKNSGSN